MRRTLLAPITNHEQNIVLDVPHHGVRPKPRVEVERRREAVAAREVQQRRAVRARLNAIFAVERVEVAAADRDVLVQRVRWNTRGISTNVESQPAAGVPLGHGLDKQDAAGEGGVPHRAYTCARECGFNGAREADLLGPGESLLFDPDRRDALDLAPDQRGRGVDRNAGRDLADFIGGPRPSLGRGNNERQNRHAEQGSLSKQSRAEAAISSALYCRYIST